MYPNDNTNDMVAGAIMWPCLLAIWGLGKLVDWLVKDRTPHVQCKGCDEVRTKREWEQVGGVCSWCKTDIFEGDK